jgi:hypothetical protein
MNLCVPFRKAADPKRAGEVKENLKKHGSLFMMSKEVVGLMPK